MTHYIFAFIAQLRWVVLLSLGMILPVWADDSALLLQQLGNITTLSAQFSQVIADAKGQTLQQVQGQLVAAKPNRFYWHSQAPYQQTIISNAETVWIVDDDLEQATIEKLDPHMGRTPALLLSGRLEQISQSFTVKRSQYGVSGSQLIEYKLTPKDSNSLFDGMVLRFRNNELAAMDLTDQTGQKTSIRFEGVKLNQPVAETRFQPLLPKGYDVMDQR